MKATDKLIEIIENNSKKDLGTIQTNKNGVRYKYDYYYVKTPFYWVVKMFEKVRNEKYGIWGVKNIYDRSVIKLDNNVTISIQYPVFNGQAPQMLTLRRLIILED